jgi:hypothetical protein
LPPDGGVAFQQPLDHGVFAHPLQRSTTA